MSKIRGILFDNDGVLAHTEATWFETFYDLMGELNIPYSREDFIPHTFVEDWGSLGWLERQGVAPDKVQAFRSRRIEEWQRRTNRRNLIEPSAKSVLTELKKTCKIGIVTNTDRENFRRIHKQSELDAVLDVIVLRDDYARGKPAPDGYEAGLEALALLSSQVIAVEDAPRGIKAAKAAGLAVIGIVNPAFPELDITTADYQIKRLAELPVLLKEISG